MFKLYWICSPILLVCATSAQAEETKLLFNSALTDYSKAYGKRLITTFESTTDFGATALTLSGSHGKRDFSTSSASAFRVSGTVFHDWSDRFFTRTNIAASSNKPVFATREISQELNFKPVPQAVLTAGGKYARYFGKVEALSWTAGGAYYFGSGSVSYRYSSYDVTRLGKSHGHLASFRLKDGKGVTQLWLGSGTSLLEQLDVPIAQKGNFRSATIQRVQPINDTFGVSAGVGRSWYRTDAGRYHGTSVMLGLVLNAVPKF